VAAVGEIADGVVGASQLIRRIEEAPDAAAAERAVAGFAADAARALASRRASPERLAGRDIAG
jgi:hypothetical protein